jgi:hypothetical protein
MLTLHLGRAGLSRRQESNIQQNRHSKTADARSVVGHDHGFGHDFTNHSSSIRQSDTDKLATAAIRTPHR